jgi:hypothetical protein
MAVDSKKLLKQLEYHLEESLTCTQVGHVGTPLQQGRNLSPRSFSNTSCMRLIAVAGGIEPVSKKQRSEGYRA